MPTWSRTQTLGKSCCKWQTSREGNALKLSDVQIQTNLARVPGWTLDGKFITRRYKFPSFPAAIKFVNAVADEAERRNHHPFIAIDYKMVTLRLTSWHAGGLTEADFDEAVAFDALYAAAS
ncbi:MAG: 4a-hydroxytetrahydrobiopterin dehydratase [Alicyclobacillus sp.]|nr:4a-hydroxytetrahydrobiopterin dehydratase [Alicyclobacillus sp.]